MQKERCACASSYKETMNNKRNNNNKICKQAVYQPDRAAAL